MIHLVIPGRLPGLNEYVRACRGSRYGGNSMVDAVERRIRVAAKSQLRGVRFDKPVIMRYIWVEPNRKRDKDNIAFAKKFVQDALVQLKILRNDGWAEIDNFSDSFAVDPDNPRVEIEIEEAVDGQQAD